MHNYKNQHSWKEIQKYLPEHNKINNKVYPYEYYWKWENNNIHIDFYKNNS